MVAASVPKPFEITKLLVPPKPVTVDRSDHSLVELSNASDSIVKTTSVARSILVTVLNAAAFVSSKESVAENVTFISVVDMEDPRTVDAFESLIPLRSSPLSISKSVTIISFAPYNAWYLETSVALVPSSAPAVVIAA